MVGVLNEEEKQFYFRKSDICDNGFTWEIRHLW